MPSFMGQKRNITTKYKKKSKVLSLNNSESSESGQKMRLQERDSVLHSAPRREYITIDPKKSNSRFSSWLYEFWSKTMLMTDEEVEKRLESPLNLCRIIEKKKNNGRSEGAKEIPQSVRDLISITANRGGKPSEIAELFEIDQSTVSKTARGLIGNRLDRDLQSLGQSVKKNVEDEAHEAALDVLMTSMKQLQPKLLDPDIKAKDLSTISANMAKVAGVMRGSETHNITNNTQVILYSPPRKSLNKYDITEV